jgi:hypothetical protein
MKYILHQELLHRQTSVQVWEKSVRSDNKRHVRNSISAALQITIGSSWTPRFPCNGQLAVY